TRFPRPIPAGSPVERPGTCRRHGRALKLCKETEQPVRSDLAASGQRAGRAHVQVRGAARLVVDTIPRQGESSMKVATLGLSTIVIALGLAGVGTWLAPATHAQGKGAGDWVSHNFDRHNSRFSPLDQINTSNVSRLTQQWSIRAGAADGKSDAGITGTGVRQLTPLVIDGVMYYNAGNRLYAVDAATGASLWTHAIDPPFSGSGRGPSYGDGYIYAHGGPYGGSVLYAIEAKSGKPLQSFGSNGRLLVAEEVVKFKYPRKESGGYRLGGPPTDSNRTVYLGFAYL